MPEFECLEGFPDDLTCCVCFEAWDNPEELKPCGDILCKKCIDCLPTPRTCPKCRKLITSRAEPHRALRNMANEVKVRCLVCSWVGTREKSRSHHCDGTTTPPAPLPAYPTPPLLNHAPEDVLGHQVFTDLYDQQRQQSEEGEEDSRRVQREPVWRTETTPSATHPDPSTTTCVPSCWNRLGGCCRCWIVLISLVAMLTITGGIIAMVSKINTLNSPIQKSGAGTAPTPVPTTSPYCKVPWTGSFGVPCSRARTDYCCDYYCSYCGPMSYCVFYSPFLAHSGVCNPNYSGPPLCRNYFQSCTA